MTYEEIQQRVASQITSLDGARQKETTPSVRQSNEEILNMIALEVKRKGG